MMENLTCYDFHKAVCNDNYFLSAEWSDSSMWPYRYSSLEYLYETIQNFIKGELFCVPMAHSLRKLSHGGEVTERRRKSASTEKDELIYSLMKTRHLLPSDRRLYHYIGSEFHRLARTMAAVSEKDLALRVHLAI
ncbi:hypothetical protein IscW_ISCW007893 [Ixodes scapularis]|uniref:Uncharacterized protein n=1 Tax=Ixodes scapularis TaxID=6945 RepID=B7PRS1_IXOSC|nr:hypothetical protein IscW_ISCW007893 [Ixodes scapularis]|eukprot:XP_002401017.1 hypothetical protein IscW_ISCW007893 [Ixodes scapularis]